MLPGNCWLCVGLAWLCRGGRIKSVRGRGCFRHWLWRKDRKTWHFVRVVPLLGDLLYLGRWEPLEDRPEKWKG